MQEKQLRRCDVDCRIGGSMSDEEMPVMVGHEEAIAE